VKLLPVNELMTGSRKTNEKLGQCNEVRQSNEGEQRPTNSIDHDQIPKQKLR
jgi:hypothetical protein